MRNAARILVLTFGAAALSTCHKPQAAGNEGMQIGDNLASAQAPENTEVETLPPDESSEASNSELSKGDDNPDVNDLGNEN